jgi:hypothetical protein
VVVGFYRVCVIDAILAHSPADYVGQRSSTPNIRPDNHPCHRTSHHIRACQSSIAAVISLGLELAASDQGQHAPPLAQ